jgi:hypothetical protein
VSDIRNRGAAWANRTIGVLLFWREGDFWDSTSVKVLAAGCFSWSKALETVTFENGSGLERIEEEALNLSGLKRMPVPASVEVIGSLAFAFCKSLEAVAFEG